MSRTWPRCDPGLDEMLSLTNMWRAAIRDPKAPPGTVPLMLSGLSMHWRKSSLCKIYTVNYINRLGMAATLIRGPIGKSDWPTQNASAPISICGATRCASGPLPAVEPFGPWAWTTVGTSAGTISTQSPEICLQLTEIVNEQPVSVYVRFRSSLANLSNI